MSYLSAWFEFAVSFASGIVGLIVGALIALIAVAWQVYEYRKLWPHSKSAWWVIKLATPVLVVASVAAALFLFNTEGMAALAVFYRSLLAALLLTALILAIVAKAWSVPKSAGFMAAASLIGSVWVGWFAVNSIGNSASNLATGNTGQRVEYRAFKHAANNAATATGVVRFVAQNTYLLSSGERFIDLAFHVDSRYKIYNADVRTKRSYGAGDSQSVERYARQLRVAPDVPHHQRIGRR
ncbi:MAG: hypothetical protein ACI9W2_004169 [Gammaproteobacteria bacterium]|jgi:hypothetical protein